MAEYCNTTTDLKAVFSEIDKYQLREPLEGWTVATGQTKTYYKSGLGLVPIVFQAGLALVVKTSIAECEATAGTYWDDTDNNLLYVHPTGTVDPATVFLEAGDDWDALKLIAVKKGAQMCDSRLRNMYSVPFIPRINEDHDTEDFDVDLSRLNAIYADWWLMSRKDPIKAMEVYKLAENFNPDIDEMKGLLNMILDGDIVLNNEIPPREAGKPVVRAGSSNSTDLFKVVGTYTGSQYQEWEVKIEATDGAPGTALFKLSYDGGSNYDLTGQATRTADSDNLYVGTWSGLDFYFPAATYTADDLWTITLNPVDAETTGAKVGSVVSNR